MDLIQAVSLFPSISANDRGEFKQVGAELVTRSRQEPGTLQYEWFYNADETQCIVHETFADSNAVLAHIANSGDVAGRLVGLGGGLRIEVLGNVSDELRAALAAWGAAVFTFAAAK